MQRLPEHDKPGQRARCKLLRMPNTRVGSVRKAVSSKAYGRSEDSNATAAAPSSRCGRSRTVVAPASPNGAATRDPTASATASPDSPDSPGSTRPTRALARMYPAQNSPGEKGQRQPAQRCPAGAVQPQQRDPSDSQQRPADVQRPPSLRQRQQQRAQELHRHRDPQRSRADRGVEGEVSAPETTPSSAAATHCCLVHVTYRRSDHREQHNRRQQQAQQGHPAAPRSPNSVRAIPLPNCNETIDPGTNTGAGTRSPRAPRLGAKTQPQLLCRRRRDAIRRHHRSEATEARRARRRRDFDTRPSQWFALPWRRPHQSPRLFGPRANDCTSASVRAGTAPGGGIDHGPPDTARVSRQQSRQWALC